MSQTPPAPPGAADRHHTPSLGQLSWLQSTLTQSANILGLSPVIVGFLLGRSLGIGRAASSVALAGCLTAVLGAISASMAVAYREPTAALSRRFFGAPGPRLVGGALSISLGGWFGVHAMALLQAVPPLLGQHALSPSALAWARPTLLLLGGAVSLAIVWRGNQGIARINAVQAPLLTCAAVWTAIGHLPLVDWRRLEWRPDAASVAMVLAAGLGDIVDMPAVLHRSRSRAAAVTAAFVTYGLVVPLLLLCGVLAAAGPGAASALDALADGSAIWRTLVSLLAIGSATLGNAGLIYAGAWSLAAACGEVASKRWRAWQAALAVAMALSPLAASLPRLLDALGLASGALGLTMLTAYAAQRPPANRVRPQAQAQGLVVSAAAAASLGLGAFCLLPGRADAAVVLTCVVAVGLTGLVLAGQRLLGKKPCHWRRLQD